MAMAHGYAKSAGKPMAVFLHSTVGLHHATMAVYNAYCDRAPVYMIVGNHMDGTLRRPGTGDWVHAVQDPAGLVRDFTKFDDQPISLESFAESAVRAYKIAMTPPEGPGAALGRSFRARTPDSGRRQAVGSETSHDRSRLKEISIQ